jgi:hypothetical protein
MQTTAVETKPTEPDAETATRTTPELRATVTPELSAETQVDPLPGASTNVVVREPIIEEAAPIYSAPMPKATSPSRGGLDLLDDNLIDPTAVARSMKSWRHTKQWIKVHCEYPK